MQKQLKKISTPNNPMRFQTSLDAKDKVLEMVIMQQPSGNITATNTSPCARSLVLILGQMELLVRECKNHIS